MLNYINVLAVLFFHQRGAEGTEVNYSFPLAGENGKGKTTAGRWQIGERANLDARRAEKFVGPSSPCPAKTASLCAPCLCGEYAFETATDYV